MQIFEMTLVQFESYMKVQDVLRFLNVVGSSLTAQFKVDGIEGNLFKCEHLKKLKAITPQQFREMECEVTTYMIEVK